MEISTRNCTTRGRVGTPQGMRGTPRVGVAFSRRMPTGMTARKRELALAPGCARRQLDVCRRAARRCAWPAAAPGCRPPLAPASGGSCRTRARGPRRSSAPACAEVDDEGTRLSAMLALGDVQGDASAVGGVERVVEEVRERLRHAQRVDVDGADAGLQLDGELVGRPPAARPRRASCCAWVRISAGGVDWRCSSILPLSTLAVSRISVKQAQEVEPGGVHRGERRRAGRPRSRPRGRARAAPRSRGSS